MKETSAQLIIHNSKERMKVVESKTLETSNGPFCGRRFWFWRYFGVSIQYPANKIEQQTVNYLPT